MKKILFFLTTMLVITACSKDDDNKDEPVPSTEPSWTGVPSKPHDMFERTVLVYMSAENNLSYYTYEELAELRQGSKGIGNNALVVYVDDANKTRNPYILWIRDGVSVDSVTLDTDPYSSSAETMSRILNFTSTYYPAQEYGLVLWGHASGWLIGDSIAAASSARAFPDIENESASRRRAYGVDTGDNSLSYSGKWMNMPTLANTLARWKHLKFIMADCCQFQCVESAYELLGICDYLIGSPAEIPGQGAPYATLTKGLFEKGDKFYQTIVDNYFAQVVPWSIPWYDTYDARTPLSVIYMPELLNLATATNEVLSYFVGDTYPNMSSLIYYMGNSNDASESVMYDMNDFIHRYTMRKSQATAADTAAYEKWKEVFDRTVIYKKNAKSGWATSGQIKPEVFSYLKDSRYGGISMFVPQERPKSWYYPYTSNGVNYEGYNKSIRHTSWYYAAHLSDFGW